ncbi:MAG: RES domain-containing protein [Clostridia bacterium]|nr:RES domain-containing protein [Clostridia bacterium]
MKNSDWDIREAFDLMKLAKLNNNLQLFLENRDKILVSGDELFDIIPNYLMLDKLGCAPNFCGRKIKKGSTLYRIREYDKTTNFSDASQWTAPPIDKRRQSRANKKEQEALYLASSELLCLWETHIKKGDKYAIATYECLEDITVGSLSLLDSENININIAAFVLNAFLVAPARKEKENVEVFEYLDKYFGRVLPKDLKIEDGILLSYKFGVMNQEYKYYDLTNQICDVIMKFFPDGIMYSSCYMPLETMGLNCSENNIVLYRSGIEKVQYRSCDIKICDHDHSTLIPIKTIIEDYNRMPDKFKARFFAK